MTTSHPKNTPSPKFRILGTILSLLLTFVAVIAIFHLLKQEENSKDNIRINKDAVISQIQSLNQLHSVAYSVDAVISAEKTGTWYKLWQDEQKGLFVARGRVLAGVDLAKMSAEQVKISQNNGATLIEIDLPSSEVFEVYLDNIQVYDWQTGLFGLVDNDPQILKEAQSQGKIEVLSKACEGNLMQMALDNAKIQVERLFSLTGAQVIVNANDIGQCRIGTNINTP